MSSIYWGACRDKRLALRLARRSVLVEWEPEMLLRLMIAVFFFQLSQGWGADGSDRDMQGRITTCPDTPNCVSSRAAPGRHYIEPIDYDGTLEHARLRLLEIIADFSLSRSTKYLTERIILFF